MNEECLDCGLTECDCEETCGDCGEIFDNCWCNCDDWYEEEEDD